MHDDAYRNLIVDFAGLTGLEDLAYAFHDGATLLVQGVAVTLHRGASVIGGACDRIDILADFGAFPEDRVAEVMRRLLEVNLLLSSAGTARLGVDADSGRVMLAWHHMLHGMSAQKLLASVQLAVQQAFEWRGSFYLDERGPLHGDLRHAMAV